CVQPNCSATIFLARLRGQRPSPSATRALIERPAPWRKYVAVIAFSPPGVAGRVEKGDCPQVRVYQIRSAKQQKSASRRVAANGRDMHDYRAEAARARSSRPSSTVQSDQSRSCTAMAAAAFCGVASAYCQTAPPKLHVSVTSIGGRSPG